MASAPSEKIQVAILMRLSPSCDWCRKRFKRWCYICRLSDLDGSIKIWKLPNVKRRKFPHTFKFLHYGMLPFSWRDRESYSHLRARFFAHSNSFNLTSSHGKIGSQKIEDLLHSISEILLLRKRERQRDSTGRFRSAENRKLLCRLYIATHISEQKFIWKTCFVQQRRYEVQNTVQQES